MSDAAVPVLLIFSGLPGSGKSSLARAIAGDLGAAYLRIDTIEQGLRDLCRVDVQAEGYRLAHRVAADNLRVGLSVVADSCNPIDVTRREWEGVARDTGAAHLNIEVVCSDAREHCRRVSSRVADVPGLALPTWSDVQRREYREWTAARVVIDTAGRSVAESQAELLHRLAEARSRGWNVAGLASEGGRVYSR